MTTLTAEKLRTKEIGDILQFAMIAADIIYAGAAVGLVDATGHARPLVAGDRFVGFAEAKVDNAAGAAADKSVRTLARGKMVLPVTGAVITDVGQAVYATDDDTFGFNPVGGSFIGRVDRFVSAGAVVVEFDAPNMPDPNGDYSKRETISANKTLDVEDNGKLFVVDTDGVVVTLPAVATVVNCKLMNAGAFGAVGFQISPAAADKIQGPDLPGTDNKDLILTKATARRGDSVEIVGGDANGPFVQKLRGIWATEG